MVRLCILMIVLLMPYSLIAETVIAWEADPAVYKVVVQKDDQTVLEIETMEPEVKLNIAPGIYRYQIQVIDPFGNIASTSEWKKLEVQESQPPYFRVEEIAIALVGDTAIPLSIRGNSLNSSLTYHLVREEENNVRIPVKGIQKDKTVSFRIDARDMAPGIWGLLATTPNDKMYFAPNALRIDPREEGSSETQQKTWILADKGQASIEIDADFKEKIEVQVKGPGKDYTEAEIVTNEDGYTSIYIDMEEAESGQYSVILKDPENEKIQEEEITIVQSEKSASWLRLRSGLSAMKIFPPSDALPVPDFIVGIESAIDVKSGWSKPFWKNLGVEVHGLLGVGPASTYTSEAVSFSGMLDMALFWRGENDGTVPAVQLGVGNLWMNFLSNVNNENLLYLRLTTCLDLNGQSVRFFSVALTGMILIGTGENIPVIGISFGRGLNF